MKKILVVTAILLMLGGSSWADTLTNTYKPVTGDAILAVHITTNANDVEAVVNGFIDTGNVEDGTLTGDDLHAAIAITTSGAASYTGTFAMSGVFTYSGTTIQIDDGSGATGSLIFQDGTDENVEIWKVDGSFLGISTEVADGINVLGGNLKVGDGTPTDTMDGEDAYIEGAVEIDGAINADGALDVAGATTVAAITASGAAIAQSTLAVTGAATLSSTTALGGITTAAAHINLDDGSGDTPLIGFIGGTNNDTITIGLDDDATSTDSDLVITLADDSGDSILHIDDSTNAEKFRVNSDGDSQMDGDLLVDGGDIGIVADTDLLQLASDALTLNGALTVTGTSALQDNITVTGEKFIYFDSTDTYIRGGSGYIEDLELAADDDIVLLPDDNVEITLASQNSLQLDRSDAGTSVVFQINNSSTGDASMLFSSDGNTISMGIDSGSSDAFKISDNSSLGTNDRFTMDTSGNIAIAQDLTVSGDLSVTGSVGAIEPTTINGTPSFFGAWAVGSNNTSTEALTDGFVMAYNTSNSYGVTILTDDNDPPTTTRANQTTGTAFNHNAMCPVRKGDYWKTTGAEVVYWLPLGADQ